MAEAQNIVNRVRRCLERGEGKGPADDEAAELAQQYAEVVERINDRLDRCVELLRKGLRSEAVHLAELAPPVLDEALALDFQELGLWRELCRSRELTAPPTVNESGVIELDEALPRHQELEELMRRHRQLALARVGLPPRIKILRRLSQSDPDNPIWGEDLEAYELARHKQIVQEAKAAAKRHDLDALGGLQKECAAVWLVRPPDQVRQAVTELFNAEADRAGREQLGPIGERLREALERGDEPAMRQALDDWDQAYASVRGEVEHQDADHVRHRLAEIDRKKQADAAWASAVRAMEHALDEQEPMETLERRWAELIKHERAIPQVIQTRYDARCAEVAVSSSRRFRLIMAGTVGVLLLVGGLIGGVIYWAAARHTAQQWHGQIAEAVDHEQWDGAKKLLDDLDAQNPSLGHEPVFQGLAQQVQQGLAADRARQKQLADAVAAVENAGVQTPDLDAMKRAESLAKTPEEKAKVQSLRSAIDAAQLARQRQRDNQFSQQLAAMREKFAGWRQKQSDGDADFATLNAMQLKLLQMLTADGVSDSLRSSVKPLEVSVSSVVSAHRDAVDQKRRMDAAIQAIRSDYAEPEQLAAAAAKFAQQFPDAPMSSALQRVGATASAAKAIATWNGLVASMGSLRVKNADEAETRLTQLKQYRAKYTASACLAKGLDDYQAYLERAHKALAPGANSDLENLLQSPLVDAVWVFRTKDGTVFYTKKGVAPQKHGLGMAGFSYAANADQMLGQKEMATKELHADKLTGKGNEVWQPPHLSPQSKFAKQAREWIHDPDKPWEVQDQRLLDWVLGDPDMDPILKAALATRIGAMAADHDWPVPPSLKQANAELGGIDTDVAWMSPDDPSVVVARAGVNSRLQSLPSLPDPDRIYGDWEQRMAREVGQRRPVAMVWRDGDNGSTVHPEPATNQTGLFQALVSRGDSVQLVTVGRVVDGAFKLGSELADLPMGTPIYRVDAAPDGDAH